jgi:hypothetical protein
VFGKGGKEMKLIPQTLVLIGLPMSAFALPPEIHFDGGGRNENILAVINEITVTAADAPHLGMVLKVKTSPGNWKNLSPVKTEKNTVYYETILAVNSSGSYSAPTITTYGISQCGTVL